MKTKNKTLLIVESPSKAKTLMNYCPSGFTIEASFGHMMDLPENSLGVSVENRFEPEFVPLKKSVATLRRFFDLSKSHNELILAMDPDREGEAISFHLSSFLKNKFKKIRRVRFREVTKQAVLSALSSPGEIDNNVVESQFARRILDRLVGYMISPVLWKKIRPGLSAGRVQSVVLKWICEREIEISSFIPEEYWDIGAVAETGTGMKIEFSLSEIEKKKAEIKNGKEVTGILRDFHISAETGKKPGRPVYLEVVQVNRINKKRFPPPPFITASLQQDAASRLSFATKKTMKIAQDLYEGIETGGPVGRSGIITYMRTDSTRISNDASDSASKYIRKNFGSEFMKKNNVEFKKKAGAQDAHEAIRPVDISLTPEKAGKFLTKEQALLYSLIWNRFVASQMAPEEGVNITIIADYEKYSFIASARDVTFRGFTALEGKSGNENKEKPVLSGISAKDKLRLLELNPTRKFTEPPMRFTESGLVRKLEKTGIGRPSTYSPTIETLLKRKYIIKEKKNFYPLSLGIAVNSEMMEGFAYLIDDSFTKEMEKKLDRIAEGKLERLPMLTEFYRTFSEHVAVSRQKRKSKELTKKAMTDPGKLCPLCKKGEVIRKATRKGKIYYMCRRFPECEFNSYEDPALPVTDG
ncbi:MAG: type I DNA topoisomerase [Leptospira sp.]|nr:type I DNA topoisomerase [Leptospira sp.]